MVYGCLAFSADAERTENGALYKPEVSSLHDLVFKLYGQQFRKHRMETHGIRDPLSMQPLRALAVW